METYIVWLQVFLKQQLKKPLYWLQLLLLLVGIYCVATIRLPDAGNCMVGYCYEQMYAKDWLVPELNAQDQTLNFNFYTEKKELYKDVASGRIDCGFVLPVHLNTDSVIESVSSPMSTKSALAKLTVFCACYRIFSEDILSDADRRLYTEADLQREKLLLEKNREILGSDRVFDVQMIEVPVEGSAGKKNADRLPVQGIAGIFVMMIMPLADGMVFEPDNRGFLKALPTAQRRYMRIIYSLSAGLLPAAVSLVLISFTDCSRGMVTELISMILLILWTQLWICLTSGRQRDPERYHVELVLFLLVQLLLCPVFMDLSEYIPALKFIRLLWPLGIYMYL